MANQIRTNPLGQIADGVVEQLKSTGSSAVGAMATEPAKILEQILGGAGDDGVKSGEQKVEQGQAPASANASAGKAGQDLLVKKQQKSQEADAAQYKLHQQRLQEEIQYHQQSKQKEEQAEQVEDQKEEREQQVVQLKREKEKEELWQQQIKTVQGSHERQQGKM